MQKIALSRIIREEGLRALVFALSLFVFLGVGLGSVAYAANGGVFGDVLNRILATGNWEAPGDGTVKNATTLGGIAPAGYVKMPPGGLTCGNNQCIKTIQSDGTPLCGTP